MVGDLVGAVIGDVGDRDALAGGSFHIHEVVTNAKADDQLAAFELVDGLGVDARSPSHDGVGLAGVGAVHVSTIRALHDTEVHVGAEPLFLKGVVGIHVAGGDVDDVFFRHGSPFNQVRASRSIDDDGAGFTLVAGRGRR